MPTSDLLSDARRADALAGALLGLALGDALGFVVEAQPPEVATQYVMRWLRAGRAGARSHPAFPFGQYSDDTQLARELLLSVRERGCWHPPTFAARIAGLILRGGDIAAGPGTRSAAARVLLGAPWDHAGTPAPYAGNGTAMRAGPVGLLFGGRNDQWLRCAREQSRVTHLHRPCAAGAVAIAGAVGLAAAPGPLVVRQFAAQLQRWVAEDDPALAAIIGELESWVALEPPDAARRLHAAGLDPLHADRWRGISACVVPTVLWSLYAFLRSPDDYWESVCTAIAAGGDTDTMAAMTGAIAGARLGAGGLPAHLLDRLTDRGTWDAMQLERLARDCARID